MAKRRGLGVGSVSLILIFSVLCLTIFALLTLSSARSDTALARRAARSAQEYYAADTEAQLILAQLTEALRSGERPDTVRGCPVSYDAAGAAFSVCAGQDRYLSVALSPSGEVTSWREVSGEGWNSDESINVYKK